MGEHARSRPEFSELLCQMPQVLFTEVLTERYAVMYRRFMTRLLSSCARLSKHALRLGHGPKVTLSKVWPGQLAHLAPPPPGARSRVWPSRLGVTTPFRGCCPVCLRCHGGKAAAPATAGPNSGTGPCGGTVSEQAQVDCPLDGLGA